jgi:hypothetical protein
MRPAKALPPRAPRVPGRSVPNQSVSRPTGPDPAGPGLTGSNPGTTRAFPLSRPYGEQTPCVPQQPGVPRSAATPTSIPPLLATGRHHRSARAVIGDALRVPVLWCQFGSCIARYTHRDALGERDLRVRALASGWRYDALGRLACPSCVQHDPFFWMTRPPVPIPRWLIPASPVLIQAQAQDVPHAI